ncbi:hypothetical protein JCM5296_004985 [Sporobolomyces johnsonii]
MPTLHLSSYISSIDHAVKQHDGRALANAFSLADKHVPLLLDFLDKPDRGQARIDRTLDTPHPSYAAQFARTLGKHSPWSDMATNHVWTLVALQPPVDPATGQLRSFPDAIVAYAKQHEVVNTLYRYLMDSREASTGWALPVLYAVCRDLRKVAEQADQQLAARGQKTGKLEEASRLLQKCFSCCLNDRASDIMTSRKMGTYYLATLLFKTYFKLNSTALCKNIIRGIGAAELPALWAFPRAHRVTYTYYMGVFAFLREDYDEAEKKFTEALEMTHVKMKRNIELINDYLIPLLLLRGILPSHKLLLRSARHKTLYGPFAQAIKDGNVNAYDRQLHVAEKRLMERGTYLVVERAREAAVRGCLKKAWILEQKPARMSVETFRRYYNAAAHVGLAEDDEARKMELDGEEMECLLANCIYKGLMKGYISHAHGLVVLSKERPFPWYQPYRPLGPNEAAAREQREADERKRVPVLPSVPGSVPGEAAAA